MSLNLPLYPRIRSNYTHSDFPEGAHVRVVSEGVDFNVFRGETGTVIRNGCGYLNIIVEFDEPRRFEGGSVQTQFGFNPENLAPTFKKVPV